MNPTNNSDSRNIVNIKLTMAKNDVPENPDWITEMLLIFATQMKMEESPATTLVNPHLLKAKQKILQKMNEARQTDEYGNPMIQLNMYEAENVCHLIKNSDPQRFDTGDWFRDVPFKIDQRLKSLEKSGE